MPIKKEKFNNFLYKGPREDDSPVPDVALGRPCLLAVGNVR